MKRLALFLLGILFIVMPSSTAAQTILPDPSASGDIILSYGGTITASEIGPWRQSSPGDGLYVRLIGDVGLELTNDLAVHEFSGEFYFYARGTETLAEITAMFNLQGDDLTDLAEIKGKFDTKGAPFGRYEYCSDLEHGLELAEGRLWDRAKFNSEMGLTWGD